MVMLIFPAFQDRLIVLVTALAMIAGLAYLVNRMRVRREAMRTGQDGQAR